jgi:hypothetical protein
VFNFEGQTYKTSVDLRHLFRVKTQVKTGGLCHLFSATSIYEAACFELTGNHVDFSEAYLAYRFYRRQFGNLEFYDHQKPVRYSTSLTNLDGGRPEFSIDLLEKQETCQESSYAFNQGFIDNIRNFIQTENQWYEGLKRKLNKRYPDPVQREKMLKTCATERGKIANNEICNLLDNHFQENATSVNLSQTNAGLKISSPDSKIRSCFQDKQETHKGQYFTHGLALKLLNNGHPFTCFGNIQLPKDFGKYKKFQAHAGKWVSHITTVIGYRKNPDFENGIEYLVRDSNLDEPFWGFDINNCGVGIDYITPKKRI